MLHEFFSGDRKNHGHTCAHALDHNLYHPFYSLELCQHPSGDGQHHLWLRHHRAGRGEVALLSPFSSDPLCLRCPARAGPFVYCSQAWHRHQEHNSLFLRGGGSHGGYSQKSGPGVEDGLCRACRKRHIGPRILAGRNTDQLLSGPQPSSEHNLHQPGADEFRSHGLQSPARLSHGRRTASPGLVCIWHALCQSHQEGFGYRKDIRDADVSAGAGHPQFHAPLCGLLRLCGSQ